MGERIPRAWWCFNISSVEEQVGVSTSGLRLWMVVMIQTTRTLVRMPPKMRGETRGGAINQELEELQRRIEELEHKRD